MKTRADIFDNIERNQKHFREPVIKSKTDREIYSKIMTLYFKYMFNAIFSGATWNIHRFGKFRIVEIEKPINQVRNTPNYYRDGKLRINKKMFNPRTLGKIFKIEVESEFLKKQKARFRAAKSMRDKMSNDLFEKGEICPLIS